MTSKTEKRIRIGVFVSGSGECLRRNLDFRTLSADLKKLPDVVAVQACPDLSSPDSARRSAAAGRVAKTIQAKKLNRVAIAAPFPWLHEDFWGDVLETAGLNRYLLAAADLSNFYWKARRSKKRATAQVGTIVKAALRRAEGLEAIPRRKIKASPRVLVVGGGLTGLSAAQEISASGRPVTLIEQSEKPGGLVKDLEAFFEDQPFLYGGDHWQPQAIIRELIGKIKNNPKNSIHTRTSIKKVRGQVGNFIVDLASPGKGWSDTFGAIVVASGVKITSPLPALKLVESPAVTLLNKAYPAIESLFKNLNPTCKVAFLLDVDSEHGVVPTGKVLSSAIRARESGSEVTVFCKNVRVAASGLEKLYRQARSRGILFTRYQAGPEIKIENNIISIQVFDEQMGRPSVSEFNLLIVAERWEADNEELLKILGLKADPERFFQQENVWLYPVRSSRRGIFVCGACREPLTIKQAGEEAVAVAAEAIDLLRGGAIHFNLNTAAVDEDKCVFCLTCYRICPHGAIEMDWENGVAKVSEAACQACGICAAECPAKAIQLKHYTDKQLNAEVGSPPRLLIFACEQSGVKSAGAAGRLGREIPPGILMVRVPCAGKVDGALILNSLQKGAKQVLILGCHQENCHYLQGSARAAKRVREIKKRLEEAGLDPARVEIGNLISRDGAKFRRYVESVRSGKCEV